MVIDKNIEEILVSSLGADLIDVAYSEGFESGREDGFAATNPYRNFSEVIFSEAWEEGWKQGVVAGCLDDE